MPGSPLGRLAVSLLLIGVLAVITVPVSAGSGDNLVLGRFNTAQADKTTVWVNSPNWGFRVKNVRSGAAAVYLENDGVSPPLRVNSTGVVDNLNVDMLDGKHMPQIRPSQEGCAIHDIPAPQEWWCTRTIDVPTGGGTLVINGSVGAFNHDTSTHVVDCVATVNGSNFNPAMFTSIGPGESDICTTVAHVPVGAGSYVVGFRTYGLIEPTMDGTSGGFSVMVIPG